MDLADRKLLELRDKLAGVTVEFDWWLAAANGQGPLRKHQSQLYRLIEQLHGYADRIGQDIDEVAAANDDVLEVSRIVQVRILEVHRLWDYFRSKFALRYVDWFKQYLNMTDEFAWACYRPALDAYRGVDSARALKEAPLVYLSGQPNPVTHQRAVPFVPEVVADAPTVDFMQIAQRLPVPLVSVPWYQATHLPDAVMIAHEVGHAVERDFDLADTTDTAFRTVAESLTTATRNSWFRWLPEVFADVYGVLCAGEAFHSGLADLVAIEPIPTKPPAEALLPHPPAAVRIRLCATVLRAMGYTTQADTRVLAWTNAFPAPAADDPLAEFVADAERVAGALLQGKYPQFGDKTLGEVADFPAPQQRQTDDDVSRVLTRQAPRTVDIRCLVAVARLAFERDPDRYVLAEPGRKSVEQLILDRATALIDDKPRAVPQRVMRVAGADRAAGAELFELAKAARRPTGNHH